MSEIRPSHQIGGNLKFYVIDKHEPIRGRNSVSDSKLQPIGNRLQSSVPFLMFDLCSLGRVFIGACPVLSLANYHSCLHDCCIKTGFKTLL